MKKFTKEQLENTYIVNDCPVKRAAYIHALQDAGITVLNYAHTTNAESYGYLDIDGCISTYNSLSGESKSKCSELHLSDLIELENSKVYTTDPEVVRKYAELCGSKVRIGTSAMHGGAIGAKFGACDVFTFAVGGTADNSNCHEITVDQINALHREKFPEQYESSQNKGETMKVDPSVYEEGMRNAMKRIAGAVGKQFGVNVGYEDLPELVESVVKSQQPKPRTRVEYVKVEFEHAWEAVKAFEEGEELYTNVSHDTYSKLDNAPDVLKYLHRLYRRVEKEVDWQEILIEFFNSDPSKGEKLDGNLVEELNTEWGNMTDTDFLEMCRVALRATGELPE